MGLKYFNGTANDGDKLCFDGVYDISTGCSEENTIAHSLPVGILLRDLIILMAIVFQVVMFGLLEMKPKLRLYKFNW